MHAHHAGVQRDINYGYICAALTQAVVAGAAAHAQLMDALAVAEFLACFGALCEAPALALGALQAGFRDIPCATALRPHRQPHPVHACAMLLLLHPAGPGRERMQWLRGALSGDRVAFPCSVRPRGPWRPPARSRSCTPRCCAACCWRRCVPLTPPSPPDRPRACLAVCLVEVAQGTTDAVREQAFADKSPGTPDFYRILPGYPASKQSV